MREISEHGMVVDPERPHLGGYFPEGDHGSWCPDVWEWAIEKFGVSSMIDVGCGAGTALDWFESHGCDVAGVDGLPPDDPRIAEHDYTLGPWPKKVRDTRLEGATDLIWCCEFVEHIDEQYIPNFLETFYMGQIVMMTHGLYWQDGHHHVNCQRPEYWIDRVQKAGFRLLGRETIESRDRALQQYWKHSGLIFKRR